MGGAVIVDGPLASYALVTCYVSHLSLDLAMTLIFPWDCVLFESASGEISIEPGGSAYREAPL